MMKIYLDYEHSEDPWGGINSFFRGFHKELTSSSQRAKLINSKSKADIVLLGAASRGIEKAVTGDEIEREYQLREKLLNKILSRHRYKLIHRLDGLRASYGAGFIPNDREQLNIAELSDAIIFQSKESKNVFEKYGLNISKVQSEIIYNGADQSIFFPCISKKPSLKKKVLATSWSTNLRKGFKKIAQLSRRQDIDVLFAGQWNQEVDSENVCLLGTKNYKELSYLYREVNFFLHAAENDPCPNVVLEALSSGLPILFHPSGGTKELSERYGESIGSNSVDELFNALDNIIINEEKIRENIIQNLNNFSFKKCFNQYLDFFEKQLI